MRPCSILGDNIHKYELSPYTNPKESNKKDRMDDKRRVSKPWKAQEKPGIPFTNAEPSLRPSIRPTVIDLVKKFKELAFQNDGCHAET